MDFRFKYNRKPPPPEVAAREEREEVVAGKQAQMLGVGLSIPFTLVSGPLIGMFAGRWLDQHFHTNYWLIILVLLGIAGSFKVTIDQLSRLNKA